MKPLIKQLDAIKELRFEHSRDFARNDFSRMGNLDTKIKLAWEAYNFARRCASERRVCFTCCKTPDEQFSIEAQGHPPMLFCSDLCRLTFGVSLGLT